MTEGKKIWYIEQYAHKAWMVSLVLMQEAARAGDYGKGYALVAHESRVLAEKLFEYTEKVRFDGDCGDMLKGIVDFAVMVRILYVNTALEVNRMAYVSMEFNIPKSMAVFADELRKIAEGLNEIIGRSVWQKSFTMPELAHPSESPALNGFFYCTIGGYPLIEDIVNVKEVYFIPAANTKNAVLSLQGCEMPIINCYDILGLAYSGFDVNWQTVMVLSLARGGETDELYAVPIDDLDIKSVFYSRLSSVVSPVRDHPFSSYARKCWDTVDGSQLVFADWQKLISG